MTMGMVSSATCLLVRMVCWHIFYIFRISTGSQLYQFLQSVIIVDSQYFYCQSPMFIMLTTKPFIYLIHYIFYLSRSQALQEWLGESPSVEFVIYYTKFGSFSLQLPTSNFHLSFRSFGPMPFCMYSRIGVIQLSQWTTFSIPTFSLMLDNFESKSALVFHTFGMQMNSSFLPFLDYSDLVNILFQNKLFDLEFSVQLIDHQFRVVEHVFCIFFIICEWKCYC